MASPGPACSLGRFLTRRTASVATKAPASSAYGTTSDVAWATTPLAAAANACPLAQARLPSPNARPWLRPRRCAPALSSAVAGVNSVP